MRQTGIALLCLDLDNFKIINDTHGHATGDGVLVAVGERLRGCIRDIDIAARLGGDEFAIILMTEDGAEAGECRRADHRADGAALSFRGADWCRSASASGSRMAPEDRKDPSRLMKNADLALYRAKADGRGVWRFYDPEMDERLQSRRALQSALRLAMSRNEFRLEFQPIVDLSIAA